VLIKKTFSSNNRNNVVNQLLKQNKELIKDNERMTNELENIKKTVNDIVDKQYNLGLVVSIVLIYELFKH
jgi:hypothetical protein